MRTSDAATASAHDAATAARCPPAISSSRASPDLPRFPSGPAATACATVPEASTAPGSS